MYCSPQHPISSYCVVIEIFGCSWLHIQYALFQNFLRHGNCFCNYIFVSTSLAWQSSPSFSSTRLDSFIRRLQSQVSIFLLQEGPIGFKDLFRTSWTNIGRFERCKVRDQHEKMQLLPCWLTPDNEPHVSRYVDLKLQLIQFGEKEGKSSSMSTKQNVDYLEVQYFIISFKLVNGIIAHDLIKLVLESICQMAHGMICLWVPSCSCLIYTSTTPSKANRCSKGLSVTEERTHLDSPAVHSNAWWRFTINKAVFQHSRVPDRPVTKSLTMLSILCAPQSRWYYRHGSWAS